VRIQACPNGARAASFHPALPLTPAALAADAAACAAAGVVAVHLHPRDIAGRETLDPVAIGAAVAAIRAAAPGLPVSVSTGAWIEADDPARRRHIAGWGALGAARPDEASVNFSEADAPAVAALLLAAGVGVEAGLATRADAARFLALGLAPQCRRILVEIGDLDAVAAREEAAAIFAALDAAGVASERQLHGEGGSVWPMFDAAMSRGLMARLGLEDGEHLPNGRRAAGNAALVAAGMRRAGRQAAAPALPGGGFRPSRR